MASIWALFCLNLEISILFGGQLAGGGSGISKRMRRREEERKGEKEKGVSGGEASLVTGI